MSDEVVAGLREIAALLQARNEQTAELSRRAEERLARFEMPKTEVPDFTAMDAKHAAEAQERRELMARQREEDLACPERVLTARVRQNPRLARVADRLVPE